MGLQGPRGRGGGSSGFGRRACDLGFRIQAGWRRTFFCKEMCWGGGGGGLGGRTKKGPPRVRLRLSARCKGPWQLCHFRAKPKL